jgi:hypothetical protein
LRWTLEGFPCLPAFRLRLRARRLRS